MKENTRAPACGGRAGLRATSADAFGRSARVRAAPGCSPAASSSASTSGAEPEPALRPLPTADAIERGLNRALDLACDGGVGRTLLEYDLHLLRLGPLVQAVNDVHAPSSANGFTPVDIGSRMRTRSASLTRIRFFTCGSSSVFPSSTMCSHDAHKCRRKSPWTTVRARTSNSCSSSRMTAPSPSAARPRDRLGSRTRPRSGRRRDDERRLRRRPERAKVSSDRDGARRSKEGIELVEKRQASRLASDGNGLCSARAKP